MFVNYLLVSLQLTCRLKAFFSKSTSTGDLLLSLQDRDVFQFGSSDESDNSGSLLLPHDSPFMPSVPMCTSSPISPLPTTSSEISLSGPHPKRRCHNYFLDDTHSSESELEFSLLPSPLEDVDRVFNCRLKASEENPTIIDANLQPAVQLKSMGKWLPKLNLNIQDREMLLNSSQWLTDMHINAC